MTRKQIYFQDKCSKLSPQEKGTHWYYSLLSLQGILFLKNKLHLLT